MIDTKMLPLQPNTRHSGAAANANRLDANVGPVASPRKGNICHGWKDRGGGMAGATVSGSSVESSE